MAERLNGKPMPEFLAVKSSDREIGYAATGPQDGALIVFVHGTPGSWQGFLDYLVDARLADAHRLVSIDRPGWGRSGRGNVETSLAAQSAAIAAVIEAEDTDQGVFVVGHSLGGTIVARLAMDRPELIDGTVIVSASLDPEVERSTWYQSMARWKLVRWVVPEDLDWANAELEPLAEELAKMTSLWPKVAGVITVLHGEKDGLVPVAHAGYTEKLAKNADVHTVVWPNEGHFVLWSNRGLVVDEILATIERSASLE